MKKITITILVVLFVVLLTACASKTGALPKNYTPEVAGIVEEVNETGSTVLVNSTAQYVQGLIWIRVDEKTVFYEGINETFEVGNTVEFKVTGGIMESYPMQGYANAVYKNK